MRNRSRHNFFNAAKKKNKQLSTAKRYQNHVLFKTEGIYGQTKRCREHFHGHFERFCSETSKVSMSQMSQFSGQFFYWDPRLNKAIMHLPVINILSPKLSVSPDSLLSSVFRDPVRREVHLAVPLADLSALAHTFFGLPVDCQIVVVQGEGL